jgi:hypothetical protein
MHKFSIRNTEILSKEKEKEQHYPQKLSLHFSVLKSFFLKKQCLAAKRYFLKKQ